MTLVDVALPKATAPFKLEAPETVMELALAPARVAAPLTFSVPPITVLPVEEATVKFVEFTAMPPLALRSPESVEAPVTPKVVPTVRPLVMPAEFKVAAPEVFKVESDVRPVTPSVPAMVVLPAAVTTNLSVGLEPD